MDAKRKSDGKFGPGNKANPGGRPREVAHVRELARAHTIEAVRTLAEVMTNPDEKGAARVAAAQALLDRGYGKATQPLEHAGPDGAPLSIEVRFVRPGDAS